jgi:hypothetical protein
MLSTKQRDSQRAKDPLSLRELYRDIILWVGYGKGLIANPVFGRAFVRESIVVDGILQTMVGDELERTGNPGSGKMPRPDGLPGVRRGSNDGAGALILSRRKSCLRSNQI